MSEYDFSGLHDFLIHTPEKGVRRTLVDTHAFSESHCSLLLKVARACSSYEFSSHCENESFPKVRMTHKESQIREKFWGVCVETLLNRGILQPAIPGSDKLAA